MKIDVALDYEWMTSWQVKMCSLPALGRCAKKVNKVHPLGSMYMQYIMELPSVDNAL